MSCWIVSREHIHVLVDAANRILRRGGIDSDFSIYTPIKNPSTAGTNRRSTYDYTDESRARLGAMLEDENRRSFEYRYGKDTPTTESLALADPYVWKAPKKRLDGIALIKAIHCFEYQACEHHDWEFSEARAFCRALEHEIVCSFPGYSEAPWGVSDP
jgi:hypothetical protein